jgi:hypothetical protein
VRPTAAQALSARSRLHAGAAPAPPRERVAAVQGQRARCDACCARCTLRAAHRTSSYAAVVWPTRRSASRTAPTASSA